MKKIVFVCDSLRIGGIQRSLVNLLNVIDPKEYEIDLFLFYNGGDYKKFLNTNINVITGKKLLTLAGMTSSDVKRKYILYIIRRLLSILCLVFGSKIVFKFIFLFEAKLKEYDTAISYSNNVNNRSLYFGYNMFVLNKVVAKKKIAWVHADYGACDLNNDYNNSEYEKFDTVINVSKTTKSNFDKVVPKCKGKSEYVYNIIPSEEIKTLSKLFNPCELDGNVFKIVSVSRLDKNKSVDELVDTADKLKKDGVNFRWYIVGDGPEYTQIKKLINEKNLVDNMYLIGYVDNPYPYIYNSNLFVSASKSECLPMSIAEALVLNTPVIATWYPSLSELIINNVNGFITGRGDDLFNMIKELIVNKELYQKIKMNSQLITIDNMKSLNKLYKLI